MDIYRTGQRNDIRSYCKTTQVYVSNPDITLVFHFLQNVFRVIIDYKKQDTGLWLQKRHFVCSCWVQMSMQLLGADVIELSNGGEK